MDARTARKTLGVSPSASEDEIKTAYRKLARAHHPDLGGNKERFVAIQEAYDFLSASPAEQARTQARERVRTQAQGHGAPSADVDARLRDLAREVEEQARRAQKVARDAAARARGQEPDEDLETSDSFSAIFRDAATQVGKGLSDLLDGAKEEGKGGLKDKLKERLSRLDQAQDPDDPEADLTPGQRELLRLRRNIMDYARRVQGPDVEP